MARQDPALRASDADRAETVERLQRHYTAGRLTVAELEERTQTAYASRTLGALDELVTDLPPDPEPEPSAAPAPRNRRRARTACGRSAGVRDELARYAGLTVMLVGIWALAGRGYFWPAWPIVVWGGRLLMRALRTAPR